MSGFLVIRRARGAPVDRTRLEAARDIMAFRSTAPLEVRIEDHLGIVAAGVARDPVRGIIAVGDVRLDRGPTASSGLEAVLDAYENDVDRLADGLEGDFAFILWDPHVGYLTAARDVFGVRQLYVARREDAWVLGDTLDAVRLVAGSSDALDETYVGDFLLFGQCTDLERTAYADIARLAPGMQMEAYDRGDAQRRFAAIPAQAPEIRGSDADITAGFHDVLRTAVHARLGPEATTVFMSGGLDSTSVAAFAAERAADTALQAVTVADDEGAPAAAVARHLAMAHRTIDAEALGLVGDGATRSLGTPEPLHEPAMGRTRALIAAAVAFGPAALTGYGGDPLLRPSHHDVRRSLGRGALLEAAASVLGALRAGDLGGVVRRPHLTRGATDARAPMLPPYLNDAFVARADLDDRIRHVMEAHRPARDNAGRHPEAVADLRSPVWPYTFWATSPEVTRAPLAVSHPFFDLRVVRYVLGVPPIPWCRDKRLLRKAMRDRLPPAILTRPKSVPRTNPIHDAILNGPRTDWTKRLEALAFVEPYVDLPRFRTLATDPRRLASRECDLLTRPLMLESWLAGRDQVPSPGSPPL